MEQSGVSISCHGKVSLILMQLAKNKKMGTVFPSPKFYIIAKFSELPII